MLPSLAAFLPAGLHTVSRRCYNSSIKFFICDLQIIDMNNSTKKISDDEMLPEYDFSGGIRGKHFGAYRRGYTITIYKADGTIETRANAPYDETHLPQQPHPPKKEN